MANQRMYLVCEQCMNDPETTFEQSSQYLTKYYPFSGWLDERLIDGVRTFFTNHDHRDTMQGKYARIIYDSEFDEMAKDRDDITNIVGSQLRRSTVEDKDDE